MTHKYGDLTGKRALVTGCSRGLGQQFARALAKAGADLAITSRDLADCAAFAREIAKERNITLAIGCRFSEVGTGSYGFTPPGPKPNRK